ncbi:MAG TPA: hypothetical protein VJT50_05125 [Pyrinomonadaceae bacterium]|nr:hypothetical protein [Pyrinomonadaceae bacterium]
MSHKKRIMYIEKKAGEIVGPARIGRVTYSKTGKTIYYRGRSFASLNGYGFKANFFDEETREEYWISGCKKDGTDALYYTVIEIDEDVREEYWLSIRKKPELRNVSSFKGVGKYSK